MRALLRSEWARRSSRRGSSRALRAFAGPVLKGAALALCLGILVDVSEADMTVNRPGASRLDRDLVAALDQAGFTGTIEASLEARLGRPVDPALADLGRRIFFDSIQGLHGDNSCAGCHSPGFGFGDSQSIAIGVDNNGLVGPDRAGPRNQRRAPVVINNAFYPKLMLNGRFVALSGDPFDNSQGFQFPSPEGTTRFPANDPEVKTLLVAQGHIPPTELVEMAGMTGTSGTISPEFDPFDDGHGAAVPAPDASGFRNEPIRAAVLARFNSTAAYRSLFGAIFNAGTPFPPGGITYSMIGRALAEFETSLTFANAPIDRYARGDRRAMTVQQKRGALLFFGSAGCVGCHAVAGASNEMFSDFQNHVLGVPQIAPVFGVGKGDVIFDGPGRDEDFGSEQITGDAADRYAFRTSPLRNVAVQPAFFHNGCFTRLEDAIRHHLDAVNSSAEYDAVAAGLDTDLTLRRGPSEPVLARLDPRVAQGIALDRREFEDLVDFVRDGLLDPRARRENLCRLVPRSLPSGRPVAVFQGCECGRADVVVVGRGKQPVVERNASFGLRLGTNPARDGATLFVDQPRDASLQMLVFDLAGRRVRQLLSGPVASGRHAVAWDGRDDRGRDVARGVYFVRLVSPDGVALRRVTLLR